MITVLGSINMDLIASVGRLPKPGETVTGDEFATAAGGKGANQALAARRAGSNVRMAGRVGDDNFAEPALTLLAAAGTDLALVKTSAGPTGIAVILVDGDGENVIAAIAGANATVNDADAGAALSAMRAGDILMVQLEIPPTTIETALRAARIAGMSTILNIAPFAADAARLSKLADIVVANETEFELLVGRCGLSKAEREAEMQHLHSLSAQTFIVTLGADGVVGILDGQLFRAAGLAIIPIDTVGAGDTFCGYLAASLDQSMPFEAALRRASVAGSLACLQAGAQPAIPMASDVDARLPPA